MNERGTGLKLCGTPFDRQSCDHFCDRRHLTSPENGGQSILLDDVYESTIFPFIKGTHNSIAPFMPLALSLTKPQNSQKFSSKIQIVTELNHFLEQFVNFSVQIQYCNNFVILDLFRIILSSWQSVVKVEGMAD